MSIRPTFLFAFTLAVLAGVLTSGCAGPAPGGVYKDAFTRAAERDAAMISAADLCGIGSHDGPKEMDYYIKKSTDERNRQGTRGGTRRSIRSGDENWNRQTVSDLAFSGDRTHSQGYGFARRGTCVIK